MSDTDTEVRLHRVESVPLVVREWPADGTPLVYWPGLNAGAPHELDEVGPVWAREYGLRVIAISPPGLGETPALAAESYRPSLLAGLVVQLLDELSLERAIFMGFSWGGFVGCRIPPERLSGLVLLEGGYTDLGPEASLEEWIEVARGIEPPLPDPAAAGAAIWGLVREPPSEARPAIQTPTLLVTGGSGAEEFSRAVPHADVRMAQGAGHELLKEAPDEVTRLLAAWLAQQKLLR